MTSFIRKFEVMLARL